MGLCISKGVATNDYATYSRDDAGGIVINRHLGGVSAGEDVGPRLARLDRKSFNKLLQGRLPYEDFHEARARQFQQAFQPSTSSRASPASSLPSEVKFLRTDSEGCLIETTLMNPKQEDVDFAHRQKAELLQQYGAEGVARLRPVGFEKLTEMQFSFSP